MSIRVAFLIGVLLGLSACSDSNEAATRGVGAACVNSDECSEEGQRCLTQFKGGYCGISDCTADLDCPEGSRCVTHSDSTNYCFLICKEKFECNEHRSLEQESNCSSNITFVEGKQTDKACVPPSGA